MLYQIEWTHDDGMDQHREVAHLTSYQADAVLALLERRGALNPAVFEVAPTCEYLQLIDQISEDLPADGGRRAISLETSKRLLQQAAADAAFGPGREL